MGIDYKKLIRMITLVLMIGVINSNNSVISAKTNTTITKNNVIQDDLHLNVKDGYVGRGKVCIKASSRIGINKLMINGQDVTHNSKPDLGGNPFFTFQVKGTDRFFKNAVAIDKNILKVLDDKISSWKVLKVPIGAQYFRMGNIFSVSIHSGTKASAFDHNTVENNDNFQVKDLKLIFPDGLMIKPLDYINPLKIIKLGDDKGENEILNCKFIVPDYEYKALNYEWDTTKVTDGRYNIMAESKNSSNIASIDVDNTPAIIDTNMKDIMYKGEFAIKADAKDSMSGVKAVSAILDGQKITLPYNTSSAKLFSGKHLLELIAEDKAGNISIKNINFTIPIENPNVPEILKNTDEAVDNSKNLFLNVRVSDPTNDDMTVKFKKGYKYTAAVNGMTIKTGISEYHPIDGKILKGNDIDLLKANDNKRLINASIDKFPYHIFEVNIPKDAENDSIAEVVWKGTSNIGNKLAMYIWNYKNSNWEIVSSHLDKEDKEFELKSNINIKNRVKNLKIKVLVQEYFDSKNSNNSSINNNTKNQNIKTNNVNNNSNRMKLKENIEDIPNKDYDFTFVWETDTQYYSKSWCQDILKIHNWIVENRDRMKISYLFHTGDIVDMNNTEQYKNSDCAFKIFDEANMPYGLLAGNHDVNNKKQNYTKYNKYFSEKRYVNNPWYGGSYKNNKGHYDLISRDGLEFIIIYMGWGIGDNEIAWMNNVLKRYPNRKAILCLHEYLEVTGGLGEVSKKIREKVIKPNSNVCMVFSGHYSGSNKVIDKFDDNGDGVNDRSVYEILFDYQSIGEGGNGYIRLMHFDEKDKKIIFRTYSPLLDDYDANVLDFPMYNEEYDIYFCDLGLVPKVKKIATDYFEVSLYTNNKIGEINNVKSGSQVTIQWNKIQDNITGWYAEASDDFGGISRSSINCSVKVNNNN